MTREAHEQVEEATRAAPRPPEPAPAPDRVAPGSLQWASAIGNQAVARLARQAAPEELEQEGAGPEEEAAASGEELAEDELAE